MIPLVAPCVTGKDRDGFMDAVLWRDVLDGGASEVRAFEEEFAEYVGCAGAVAVNSGTSALMTVLYAWDEDRIGIPSYTCRAVADAVRVFGWEATLLDNQCDVAQAQFGLSGCLEGHRTVLTHMFGTETVGVPTSVHDITLSLGAVHAPRLAVCSFNRDKMISTGRGGMIVSQDEAFLGRCRELAYYDQPSNGAYTPAFSLGMTGMQAALGRSQLAQLPGFIERRKEIAARYTEAFSQVGIETPNKDVNSVFFRYIIGVDNPAERVRELAARGVEAGRGVNPPLHRLLGLSNDAFPGAEQCFSSLLSVPCHPSLTDANVEFVARQVLETCAP